MVPGVRPAWNHAPTQSSGVTSGAAALRKAGIGGDGPSRGSGVADSPWGTPQEPSGLLRTILRLVAGKGGWLQLHAAKQETRAREKTVVSSSRTAQPSGREGRRVGVLLRHR